MYKIVAATTIAIGLGFAFPASADSLRSESAASSQSLAASQAAAGAVSSSQGGGGGSVIFNPSPAATSSRVHQTFGTQTIRSAPQVVAPSMSSGHPCAWSPLSVGVSVVGFGGALGGQRIDDACLLAQMGVGNASILMIAQRNPSACQALLAVGRVASCGGRKAYAAPVAAAAPVRYTRTANNGSNCRDVFATPGTTKRVCY